MKVRHSINTPLLGWRDHRERRRRRFRLWTAVAVTVLILFGLESNLPVIEHWILKCFGGANSNRGNRYEGDQFDWDAISAADSLKFHSCFGGFECAKLNLPIDYFNGTHPDTTVSIAIAKLPAKVPVTDPRYGGPVLINPGGPGGSGVALAVGLGKQLQLLIDPVSRPDGLLESQGKFYDILGFDPRGISSSEPKARCMPDGPTAWSWQLRESTEGMLGSSDAALGRLWSMSHAFGTSCKQNMEAEDGPDIKQYMSTASVARDMLEIAEKHAEWVADKVSELRSVATGSAKLNPVQYQRGTVKVQYWGFSYGTYLGSTFASMFPDRVARLVLDGVVNAYDYNNALAQGSLHDTEKGMSSFYTFCYQSGPERCLLAASASSAQDIEQRVQNIIKSLFHNPLAINSPLGPEVITYTDVKGIIFSALYQPVLAFPFVADLLADIENGGGATLDALARGFSSVHVYSCSINGSAGDLSIYQVAQDAILCGDGHDQTYLNQSAFEEYWHLLEDISPAAGPLWSILKMRCASWNIKAVYRFGNDENFGGNTSHPILWVSNTADPVTPLRSGRIMARKFPGSVVLVQDSAGHCSISTPTPCTINAIREYFQTGLLPDPELVCIPPTSPLSLNSTDPSSPFYDPSLGKTIFVTGEDFGEDMAAAKELQWWAASANFLGRSQLGQRINNMVTTALQFNMEKVRRVDEL